MSFFAGFCTGSVTMFFLGICIILAIGSAREEESETEETTEEM